jgi:hypothetical protein
MLTRQSLLLVSNLEQELEINPTRTKGPVALTTEANGLGFQVVEVAFFSS